MYEWAMTICDSQRHQLTITIFKMLLNCTKRVHNDIYTVYSSLYKAVNIILCGLAVNDASGLYPYLY